MKCEKCKKGLAEKFKGEWPWITYSNSTSENVKWCKDCIKCHNEYVFQCDWANQIERNTNKSSL